MGSEMCIRDRKSTDSAAIKSQLSKWFTEYGWPKYIRSDGGPQFRKEFADFCKSNGMNHELSSPYNPESNSLAEAAVKNMKAIVTRCNKLGEDTDTAIAAWCNCPLCRNIRKYTAMTSAARTS